MACRRHWSPTKARNYPRGHLKITSYHPQSNGLVERLVIKFKRAMNKIHFLSKSVAEQNLSRTPAGKTASHIAGPAEATDAVQHIRRFRAGEEFQPQAFVLL